MKSLYEYILEGEGHAKMRLGAGSSGVTYDLGNGKVRKTLRVAKDGEEVGSFGIVRNTPRRCDSIAIERWAKIKKGLKVIPYIEDVDYDGYTMDKVKTPCIAGEWIDKAMRIFSSPDEADWTEVQIKSVKAKLGDKKAEWVMDWLRDFCHDYYLIMGQDAVMSPDIRVANIGKDKNGRVVCFDWFNPYYF